MRQRIGNVYLMASGIVIVITNLILENNSNAVLFTLILMLLVVPEIKILDRFIIKDLDHLR